MDYEARRQALAYLHAKIEATSNNTLGNLDPTLYLQNEEAYRQAGEPFALPQLPVAKKQKVEDGNWLTNLKDYFLGTTGDELKEQQANFAEFNKAKQEELAQPSTPGTYSFGYNNSADYTPTKVAKAIANGDLKESNQQLYRKYYDKNTNRMLYETVPIASIDKYGAIKPYEYQPSLLEDFGNIAKIGASLTSPLAPTIANMKYNQDDFAKKARAKVDLNNLGHAAYEGVNTFVDAFDPTEIANAMLNNDRKSRTNMEMLRDSGGKTTLTGGFQLGGQVAASVAKMIGGNALGGAWLGAALPELGEHTRSALEDGDYLAQATRLGIDVLGNRAGMAIGGKLGSGVIDAIANKGTKAAIAKSIGKNIAYQVPVDASQAALDLMTDQVSKGAIQKQLYGQETTGEQFAQTLALQVGMSMLFNGITELPKAARAIYADAGLNGRLGKMKQDAIINNIEKRADNILSNVTNGKMTKQEIDTFIASKDALKIGRNKQGNDILKSMLYHKSDVIDYPNVANGMISSIDAGLDDDAILKQLRIDGVAVTPLDVEVAKAELTGLRSQLMDAPKNEAGTPAKLEAFGIYNEDGTKFKKLGFRWKHPEIKENDIDNPEVVDMETSTVKPVGKVETVADGTMQTIAPDVTAKIATYVKNLSSDIVLAKTPHIIEKLHSLFGTVESSGAINYDNPDGVRRIFSAYTKITGQSPLNKDIAEVVMRVISHLQGKGTRRGWGNNDLRYEYINKQNEGEYTDPVTDIVAYGDRKKLFDDVVKMAEGKSYKEKLETVEAAYGLKTKKGDKSTTAHEFAEATAKQKMGSKDMLDAIMNFVATAPVEPVGLTRVGQTPQPGPAPTPVAGEILGNEAVTELPSLAPVANTPAPKLRLKKKTGEAAQVVPPDPNTDIIAEQASVAPLPAPTGDVVNTTIVPSDGSLNLGKFDDLTGGEVLPRTDIPATEVLPIGDVPATEVVNTPESAITPEVPTTPDAEFIPEARVESTTSAETVPDATVPDVTAIPEVAIRQAAEPVNTIDPVGKEEVLPTGEDVAVRNEEPTVPEVTDPMSTDQQLSESKVNEAGQPLTLVKEEVNTTEGIDIPEDKTPKVSDETHITTPEEVPGTGTEPELPNTMVTTEEHIADKVDTPVDVVDKPEPNKPVVYDSNGKAGTLAKKQFWNNNPGLKDSLSEEAAADIEEVLGKSKKITDVHRNSIDDILKEDGYISDDFNAGNGIDSRISEIDNMLEDTKPDNTETTIDEDSGVSLKRVTQSNEKKSISFKKKPGKPEPSVRSAEDANTDPVLGDGSIPIGHDRLKDTFRPGPSETPTDIPTAAQGVANSHANYEAAVALMERELDDYGNTSVGIKEDMNKLLANLGIKKKVVVKVNRVATKEGSAAGIEILQDKGSSQKLNKEDFDKIVPRLGEVFGALDDYDIRDLGVKDKFMFDQATGRMYLNGKPMSMKGDVGGEAKAVKVKEMSRDNSIVDFREKIRNAPEDIVTSRIIGGKLEIGLDDTPEAKDKFVSWMKENDIDTDRYFKSIRSFIKNITDPAQVNITRSLDVKGINGSDGQVLKAEIIPYANQIMKNRGLAGLAIYVGGSLVDDEEENSGLGKFMRLAGGIMMASYMGGKGLKWYSKIMAQPVRDATGKFISFDHIIQRVKSNPLSLATESPLKKIQTELTRSQMNAKERVEFDSQLKSFENTENMFKKSTTKIGRNFAQTRGERIRMLQDKATAGKIMQDRFYNDVNNIKNEFHEITGNNIELEAQIIRANDAIYTEATDIRNSLKIKKADKKGAIKEVTSPSAVKAKLLAEGIAPADLDKAYSAYTKMREVSDTATKHYVRAWLMGYDVDPDNIPKILDDLTRKAIPTKAEIDVQKQAIKDIKAELKNPDIDDDMKKTLQSKIALHTKIFDANVSQLKLIHNRMKFMKYAKEFADESAAMHHVIDRWAWAKKDKPYGLAIYEVASDNTGRYIRANDVTSVKKEMKYYKTVEERNSAEQRWIDSSRPVAVEGHPNIYKVTGEGGRGDYYVRVENAIDNNLNAKYQTTNKSMMRQQILELLKSEASLPAIRDRIAGIRADIGSKQNADWNGDTDVDNDTIYSEMLDAADKALENITDRADAIKTIKDIFKYTLQPKARPFYRNKNVNGYQPDSDKGWVDMWASGLDSQMKSTGNKYVSATWRSALENEIIDAKMVGFEGEYTKYLASMLGDLNNTKNQSFLPEDSKIARFVRSSDAIQTTLALAANIKSNIRNLIEGNLGNYIGLVGDGSGLIRAGIDMVNTTRGLKSAFKEDANATPYNNTLLDMVHKELINSRVPYATTVEHSKQLSASWGNKLRDKLMVLTRYTEMMNRYQGGMAAAAAMMRNNPYSDVADVMSKEDYVKNTILKSANFVYATQGNFDFMWRTDAEKLLLKKIPFGSNFLTFKAPFINQVALYGSTLKRAVHMSGTDQKQAARMVAALCMAPLFGGVAAIPGVADLIDVVDIFGMEDKKNAINSTINDVESRIKNVCRDVTGSTQVADVMGDSFTHGLLSAITGANLSGEASIAKLAMPFIAQKYAEHISDVAGIVKGDSYVEDMLKLIVKQAPAIGRLQGVGEQVGTGYKLDSNGNPLSEELDVKDMIREAAVGKSLKDIKSSQMIFKGDDELTPQGLHKTLVELRSYNGIQFSPSAIANNKMKERVTNTMRDAQEIRDAFDETKHNMGVVDAVKSNKEKLKQWVSDNPLKAARIAGKWLGDEKMVYAGKNRDLEKMMRAMDNKVVSYYKANIMSQVIEDMAGVKSRVRFDKIKVDYNGRVVSLGEIPFDERGYYYAIGSAKDVKKKDELYADEDE